MDVQTACSTSLVAVCQACQSLLAYQSDMALAGGVAVGVPLRAGHHYPEGGIFSPDGHCRPFDAQAQGTVNGDGVGLVVLKRLADAIADGDTIRAVIRGSALNNDGAAKMSFPAPSPEGQADAIATALAVANVPADSSGYVEAHGTGTPLGDPIEIAGLTQAFRAGTDRTTAARRLDEGNRPPTRPRAWPGSSRPCSRSNIAGAAAAFQRAERRHQLRGRTSSWRRNAATARARRRDGPG
jgi:acyl transferase domain-containing protein